MGFFNRLFSSNESSNEKEFDWIPLNDIKQLDEIITQSNEKTVIIFKHSTRCIISKFALKKFEENFNFPKEEILSYYLDLLSFREISNEIAKKFEVEHQSPQLLVIKNGKAVYSSSHSSIEAEILGRFV